MGKFQVNIETKSQRYRGFPNGDMLRYCHFSSSNDRAHLGALYTTIHSALYTEAPRKSYRSHRGAYNGDKVGTIGIRMKTHRYQYAGGLSSTP